MAALDKFVAAAEYALVGRCASAIATAVASEGGNAHDVRQQLMGETPDRQTVRDVSAMHFRDIVRETVDLAGIKPQLGGPEGYAKAFLRMGSEGDRLFCQGHPLVDGIMGTVSTPIYGPGDLPNLMDGVANKVVSVAMSTAPVTYHAWCAHVDDMSDYNPKQIVIVAGTPEFDEQPDGKPVEQHGFSELNAYIQIDEYSKGTKLTPKMIVNGNLSVWARMLAMLQLGLERTVNRLAVNLLLNNATCPIDNVALFHANHANIVSSGGAPSLAQAKAMRKLINAQAMPGDTEEAGLDLNWVMVGSNWVTENQQTFDMRFRVNANTLAEANVFNGMVNPLYEPMISSGGNTYYGGCDPHALEGIVYSFLAGTGPGGQRVTYYDPQTRCQSFDFFSRVGFQLVNYQGFVRNPGQ